MASDHTGRNNRTYAANTKPSKIDLLSEEPRRESICEQQLGETIKRLPVNFFSQGQSPAKPNLQQVYNYSNQTYISSTEPSSSSSFASETIQEQIVQPNKYKTLITSADAYPRSSSEKYEAPPIKSNTTLPTRITNTSAARDEAYIELGRELLAKEAQLKRELAYLNQYQNSWSLPRPVREPRREPAARVSPAKSDHKWTKECPSGSSSRPTSRASSTRSNTEADLLEKTEKLMQDVEELERKPLHKRQILIESGANSSSTGIKALADQGRDVGSVHTAIIKLPNHEINNKSPLPFSFDNFSTHGVRGNIASVGAAEPDTPYAPIFPTVIRTPSPNNRRT